MKLRTELTKASIEIEDSVFHVEELSTLLQTEVAIASRDSKAASLKTTFMHAVVGWENATNLAGDELECTYENKELVFEANQDVVEKILEAYQVATKKAVAAQKKISRPGAGGTSKRKG